MATAQVDPKTTQVEPEVPEVPDTHEPFQIGNETFSLLGTTLKKGRGKGKSVYVLEPENNDFQDLFNKLREAVGEANWDKIVYQEVVRKACLDSTTQALNNSSDGQVHDDALAKAIQEWFIPGSRRGEHVKDLRDKAQEIFGELNPLLLRHFQHKPGEEGSLNEDERNRMLQLTLEYSELNAKIEGKSRKGKAKKS